MKGDCSAIFCLRHSETASARTEFDSLLLHAITLERNLLTFGAEVHDPCALFVTIRQSVMRFLSELFNPLAAA
jgi:hypothetical protein